MDARAAGAASCVDVPEGQLRDRRRQVLEETFALGLLARQLLQGAERLIDSVVANTDLHVVVTTFLGLSCNDCRRWPYSKAELNCLGFRNN